MFSSDHYTLTPNNRIKLNDVWDTPSKYEIASLSGHHSIKYVRVSHNVLGTLTLHSGNTIRCSDSAIALTTDHYFFEWTPVTMLTQEHLIVSLVTNLSLFNHKLAKAELAVLNTKSRLISSWKKDYSYKEEYIFENVPISFIHRHCIGDRFVSYTKDNDTLETSISLVTTGTHFPVNNALFRC